MNKYPSLGLEVKGSWEGIGVMERKPYREDLQEITEREGHSFEYPSDEITVISGTLVIFP